MKTTLGGILPALLTPLDGEELITRSMETLLERMYAAGSDGVYVCGQTGEGLLLSSLVRKQAAELAVANSPAGKQVVVHVGAARTSEAVDLARHAARAGAHAISSLPPSSAFSFAEVRRYYEAIAAASDLPVLVYFFPDYSRAVSSLDQMLDLCTIPNVAGLKYTDFDIYRLSLIARSGHLIFNGKDEACAAGFLMGASGGIGSFYNLVPELFVELWRCASSGDWVRARQIQDRINDLVRVVLAYPMVPALKRLLTWSGIECGQAVAPRRPLTADEEQQLRAGLKNAGFEPEGFLVRPTAAIA